MEKLAPEALSLPISCRHTLQKCGCHWDFLLLSQGLSSCSRSSTYTCMAPTFPLIFTVRSLSCLFTVSSSEYLMRSLQLVPLLFFILGHFCKSFYEPCP